ncbi:MAG: hypothetical protein G8237_07170 [Magnetococcales bacterium]|nr:hypothetical protein [Magnetococcales bacterium]
MAAQMTGQSTGPRERKNRRKTAYNPAGNPLLWCKWVGYLFWVMAMYFAQMAKPPDESFFHRLMNMGVTRNWNRDLMTLSWLFLILTALVAFGGLILNATRLRRKDDQLSAALIVLIILNMIAMGVLPAGNPIGVFLSHL